MANPPLQTGIQRGEESVLRYGNERRERALSDSVSKGEISGEAQGFDLKQPSDEGRFGIVSETDEREEFFETAKEAEKLKNPPSKALKGYEKPTTPSGLAGPPSSYGSAHFRQGFSRQSEDRALAQAQTAPRQGLSAQTVSGQSSSSQALSPRNRPKGFLGKTLQKGKAFLGKTADFLKHTLPFLYSEREVIALAERLCQKSSPFILSQVVYQSVKAPQIEPVEEQDKDEKVFDNYDLLRDKPAGLIARVERSSRSKKFEGFSEREKKALNALDIFLSLKIRGEVYDETACSRNLSSEAVRYRPNPRTYPKEIDMFPRSENCRVNWEDLGDKSLYKFMPLPTNSESLLGKRLGPAKVEIMAGLKHKEQTISSCQAFTDFTANMFEPRKFKILFTGINGKIKNCKYGLTDYSLLKSYMQSRELKKDFYDMFPVSPRLGKKPIIHALPENQYIQVACDEKNNNDLYLDIINLNKLREAKEAKRIIALVPEAYITHYRGDKISGFMYYKVPKKRRFFWGAYSDTTRVPSYQAGFVREDQIHKGTFLHELAHTLGQRKEFYKSESLKEKTPNKTPYYHCAQFTHLGEKPGDEDQDGNIIGIPCPDYRIAGGLSREPHLWKLLNNQLSIMHSASKLRDARGNYLKRMDRDTYQKTFKTALSDLRIPEDQLGQSEAIRQKRLELLNCARGRKPVISVSGIFKRGEGQKKSKIKAFSAQAYVMREAESFFFGESFSSNEREEEDYLSFQLKKGSKMLEEIISPRKAYLEVFYEDGSAEHREISHFPLTASFAPICGAFKPEDYEVSVREIYKEGGKTRERILIDFVPVKWRNGKGDLVSGLF